MPVLRLEADSPERTQIGEGLVTFAVQTGRLETGREEGRYFLQHADGCAEDGRQVRPGDPFAFDTETGEIRCLEHAEGRSGDATGSE